MLNRETGPVKGEETLLLILKKAALLWGPPVAGSEGEGAGHPIRFESQMKHKYLFSINMLQKPHRTPSPAQSETLASTGPWEAA